MLKFVSVKLSPPYTPPERDPRDDDRAHQLYAVLHRIKGEHQYRNLDEDGRAKFLALPLTRIIDIAWKVTT